jgi:hypothetical protein
MIYFQITTVVKYDVDREITITYENGLCLVVQLIQQPHIDFSNAEETKCLNTTLVN